jgi:hypothetical protein
LSDFNENCIFWRDFQKILKISNFTKIRPVEAELFHAEERKEGQTKRHDKANNRFSKFCERALKPLSLWALCLRDAEIY